MHEVAIAGSLLRIILETAERHGGGRVESAHLLVGALSCVNVECLRFGFEALARGTPAAACTLEVRRVPIRVRCATCGGECEIAGEEPIVLACSACGGRDVTVVAGRELDLETITIE